MSGAIVSRWVTDSPLRCHPERRNGVPRAKGLVGSLRPGEIARGPAAIDAEIECNRPLIAEGGFVPAIDHSVSADISFSNYCHFLERLQRALEV